MQQSPTFLAPGNGFIEESISIDKGGGRWSGDDSGTFIVHFVSIIVTSAPPQIIRHLILEVGVPCFKGQTGPPCLREVDSSAWTGEVAPGGCSDRAEGCPWGTVGTPGTVVLMNLGLSYSAAPSHLISRASHPADIPPLLQPQDPMTPLTTPPLHAQAFSGFCLCPCPLSPILCLVNCFSSCKFLLRLQALRVPRHPMEILLASLHISY